MLVIYDGISEHINAGWVHAKRIIGTENNLYQMLSLQLIEILP